MGSARHKPKLIALFTDFGSDGIYTGQMRIALARAGVPVIDLLSNAPAFNPRASAYLLSALIAAQEPGILYLCVVDPGVGSDRLPLLIATGRNWFVGPDNGLFSQILKGNPDAQVRSIEWPRQGISNSFHGRDLFAPVAERVCQGLAVASEPLDAADLVGSDWPSDLAEVIYIDSFGNLMTGIRAGDVAQDRTIKIHNVNVPYARTFSLVEEDQLFWYENSIGLVEIAANKCSAATMLDALIGTPLVIG